MVHLWIYICVVCVPLMRQFILKYSNFSSIIPELFTKHGEALLTGQSLINETADDRTACVCLVFVWRQTTHPRWTVRMCRWIPEEVLRTFSQFFHKHLNITFMEFWRKWRLLICKPTNTLIWWMVYVLITYSSCWLGLHIWSAEHWLLVLGNRDL